MSQQIASLYADIGARTDNFEAGAKRVKGSLEALAPGIENAREKMTKFAATNAGLLAVAAVGFKVFVDYLKFSENAAAESEKVQAQLNQTIVSTGGAAGITAYQIDKMATALSRSNAIDDEAIKKVDALLLTFTKIGGDVMPDATQAILDMNTALGGDLQGTAIQVGKALNGTANGVTALAKSGVSFTDEQRKMISTLFETGRAADAQRIIIAELNKEFGGQAVAAANTYAGSQERLRIAWENNAETVGGPLASAHQKFNNILADLIEKDTVLQQALQIQGGGYQTLQLEAGRAGMTVQQYAQSLVDQRDAMYEAALGQDAYRDAVDRTAASQAYVIEQTEDLTQHYQELFSSITDMQSETDRFTEAQDAANAAIQQANSDLANGSINQQEHDRIVSESTAKLNANAEAHKRWAAETVFSFAMARAAADGNISQGEGQILEEVGVKLGLFDQQTADAMASVNEAFDSLDTENADAVVSALQSSLDTLVGKDYTITINTVTTGSAPNPQAQPGGYGYGYAEGTNGWVSVPPGFNNDSYPIRVQSGEEFSVRKKGDKSGDGASIQVMEMIVYANNPRELARGIQEQFS